MPEHDKQEREPIIGRVIQESASSDKAAIEEVVSSLRLLTGGAPTRVQDAHYESTEDIPSIKVDNNYPLPSNIVNPKDLSLSEFVRRVAAGRINRKTQVTVKRAA